MPAVGEGSLSSVSGDRQELCNIQMMARIILNHCPVYQNSEYNEHFWQRVILSDERGLTLTIDTDP